MTTHKPCCTQPFQWSCLMCFLSSQLQHSVHKPTHAQAWQAWATSQKTTTTTKKKEKFLLVCIVSTSSFSGCTDQGSDKPYSCVLLCANQQLSPCTYQEEPLTSVSLQLLLPRGTTTHHELMYIHHSTCYTSDYRVYYTHRGGSAGFNPLHHLSSSSYLIHQDVESDLV